jgi:hypothetical protein
MRQKHFDFLENFIFIPRIDVLMFVIIFSLLDFNLKLYMNRYERVDLFNISFMTCSV